MSQEAGQIVNGKYRLERMLGDGGMGTVWKARHEKLSIPVALKFLHADLNRKQTLVDRFLQEARASAQIRSEHVVRTSDVDTTPDGAAFIVLEYLEGQTLQALYEEYHKGGERLTYAEALSFAMQMVVGLEAAHEAGVVHRDLKPDNLMITKNSRGDSVLKLLDFGIAKLKIAGELERGLTRPGVIMGTPEYMAPEQAYSADGVDSRADVFSLGDIVFEMLAGRRPAGGDDPRALAQAYISGQTAKLADFVPNIAPELAAAVHKAMSPLAKDRWPTARAFREAIEPYASAARPPSVSNRPPAVAPSGGSAPVMPPVALSTAGGHLDHGSAGATSKDRSDGPPSGSAGVAKTWPPDGDDANANATKAMSPFASGSPGTVAAVEMTAMMSEAYPGGGTALASPPQPQPQPQPLTQNATGPRLSRKKKKSMSLGSVLAIAGGVAAVVVAGVLLVVKGPTSNNSDDDDRPSKSGQAQPVPAPASGQPNPQDLPAIVQPGQPAPPPQQPQAPQPVPPPPPPQGQPRGPRQHPSSAPTAPPPGVPGVPGVPSGIPNAPGLPPGVPNIPGLPTAPTAPPTSPSGAPTAPPAIPGVPNIPGLPSGLPNFPQPAPFPTPGQ